MKKITINEKEYPISGQLRALVIWEAISKKPFRLEFVADTLLFYYCMLLAGADAQGEELTLTYDEFLDAYEDPAVAMQFARALADTQKMQQIFGSSDDKKKASTPRKSTQS